MIWLIVLILTLSPVGVALWLYWKILNSRHDHFVYKYYRLREPEE